MKEVQKDPLVKPELQAAQLASCQAMANNVDLQQPPINSSDQTKILNNVGNANTDDNRSPPCDEESQKGRFGWTTIGETYIPYIFRASEKYCSIRIVENKLLNKYLHCLHSDIYSSVACVRSYYITQAEAALLHDINSKHCDCEFTKENFTQKDRIVRLLDAFKFYQFLNICYRKLITGSKSPFENCGFIRINKDSVVPYTMRNGKQVVPLFYFEGETENLKQKAVLLSGWELAYLKFCCKVQDIRNELFSSENVAVISLADIKSYFPNGTKFEDYWPSKVLDSNLLIGNRSNSNNTVNWTLPPPTNFSLMSQPQNNLPSLHTQMLASQGRQTHAANNRNQYPTQYAAYNNAAISIQPVSSHGRSNAPPPPLRSADGQNDSHIFGRAPSIYLQQRHQQQAAAVVAAQRQQLEAQQQRMATAAAVAAYHLQPNGSNKP